MNHLVNHSDLQLFLQEVICVKHFHFNVSQKRSGVQVIPLFVTYCLY